MASKKEQPVRAIFDNVEVLTSDNIADSAPFKLLLKTKAPECIQEAFRANSVFATLFEINDSGAYIELHRNDWISALESCIAMYVEEEDYDTCGKLTALIHEIKDKHKRLKK